MYHIQTFLLIFVQAVFRALWWCSEHAKDVDLFLKSEEICKSWKDERHFVVKASLFEFWRAACRSMGSGITFSCL